MKYLQTILEFAQLKPGQIIYRWFGELHIYRVHDVIVYDNDNYFVTVQLVDKETDDIKHLTITNHSLADHEFYYADRSVMIGEIKRSINWLNDRISEKLKEINGHKKGIEDLENLLSRI